MVKSRLLLCELVLICGATVAHGQWLEKIVYLPDSSGGLTSPCCLVFDSVNGSVYVGGANGNCVLAIDGATNERTARIPTGTNGKALCYNPTNNRVYCANGVDGTVTVIDGATNMTLATATVGSAPSALCCQSDRQSG